MKKFLIILILVIALSFLSATSWFLVNYWDRLDEYPNWHSRLSYEEKQDLAFKTDMSNNREDYDSNAIFANFRAINIGSLKKNYIFRGASPYLNEDRTPYVNKFLEKYNIKNVISLSEDKKGIEACIKNENVSDLYFTKEYTNKLIDVLGLNYSVIDLNNNNDVKKIITSFNEISKSDGNVYIHCAIGRDRTGLYCLIVESLAGASYEEIVNDYMESFKNYSFITKEDTPTQYYLTKHNGIDSMIHALTKTDSTINPAKLDLKSSAETLLKNNGMTDEELQKFINKICN